MAAQQTPRKQARTKRDKKPEDEATRYEQELASYLQERIKPGLNKGSIPLLARSIAKDLAQRQRPDGASSQSEDQDEPGAEAEDQPTGEAEDEPTGEAEDDFEDEDEDEDEPRDEAEDEPEDEPEDEFEDEPADEPADGPEDEDDDGSDGQQPDFEADMRELQAELGEDWILTFSVKGEDAWLTAEKEDGSQHVEAQTADLLLEAVELLEEGGGRSG